MADSVEPPSIQIKSRSFFLAVSDPSAPKSLSFPEESEALEAINTGLMV